MTARDDLRAAVYKHAIDVHADVHEAARAVLVEPSAREVLERLLAWAHKRQGDCRVWAGKSFGNIDAEKWHEHEAWVDRIAARVLAAA